MGYITSSIKHIRRENSRTKLVALSNLYIAVNKWRPKPPDLAASSNKVDVDSLAWASSHQVLTSLASDCKLFRTETFLLFINLIHPVNLYGLVLCRKPGIELLKLVWSIDVQMSGPCRLGLARIWTVPARPRLASGPCRAGPQAPSKAKHDSLS